MIPEAVTADRLAHDIAAARAIGDRLGLGGRPLVLKAAHHTTVRLVPHAIVARVMSGAPLDWAAARAVRELAVALHLETRGAPTAGVVSPELAGPHVTASAVVTLWPYVAPRRRAGDADAGVAAQTLARIHHGLRDYAGTLPPYTEVLDRCWRALHDGPAAAALSASDHGMVAAQFRRLRDKLAAAKARLVPLHGDVHLGNLLIGARPVWIDLEDACFGPREIDLAGLPAAAWPAFTDADPALIAACADLKSVCVAVWCAGDAARSAEMAAAAAFHLRRVRNLPG